jgi:hypothetical protein
MSINQGELASLRRKITPAQTHDKQSSSKIRNGGGYIGTPVRSRVLLRRSGKNSPKAERTSPENITEMRQNDCHFSFAFLQ